ncbi:MAG: sugar-binding protein [Planctomycetaceae bacterium]|nr:sugar-binding protein [Planctomycetaceae bacterium]
MNGELLSPIVCLLAIVPVRVNADYPVMSHRYLADPTSLVVDDRVYIYCSNDDESPVEGGYNIPNVICVSSSDLKNWTDHGSVFRASDDTEWAQKTWAPAAARRDGKYFLYFGNGGANIGVVVSDSPVGPFEDPLGKALIEHRTPGVQPAEHMWLFDPGVFIDDDGQAYIYFGGNGDNNVRAAKLNRDMISLDGDVVKMSAPAFFEAAWVHKRDGVYYFSYSTQPRAQMRIDYMTSDNPIEGFEYRGVVADQPPVNNNNNHAAIFKLKDRWYHVFHNRVVAKAAGIPTGFRRNLGVEELHYNRDGSIQKIEYTENGVEQIGTLDPYGRVEGETFHAESGVETETCSAGGMCLTDLQDGDWVKVVGVDMGEAAPAKFEASVAAEQDGGFIEIRLRDPTGRLIGKCPVSKTGGLQEWRTASCDLENATGVHDICLVFRGNGDSLFNLDCWSMTPRN